MTKDELIQHLWERSNHGTMREDIEAAYEAGAALEREECAKRRGTLMFNPYTGWARDPADIRSDPYGILLLDPEQPVRAAAIRARKPA